MILRFFRMKQNKCEVVPKMSSCIPGETFLKRSRFLLLLALIINKYAVVTAQKLSY